MIEQPHGAIKFVFRLGRARIVLPAGGALDVRDNDRRIIVNVPAELLNPVRPIQVLTIHPENLVQQARLRDGFAPDQHERAYHGIDLGRLIRIEIGHVVAAKAFAARK